MLLINKRPGISSFDVIRILKKRYPRHKFGHAGTLDKEAEGLLIVLVDKETKEAEQFIGLDKEYESTLVLGIKTDTGDLSGKILSEQMVSDISPEKIQEAFKKLLGTHKYKVPLYSAIKVNGKALYKYAREGKVPPRIPEKNMTLKSYKIKKIDKKDGKIYITANLTVSSGTYIRSINEKIGEILKLPSSSAHIKRLRIAQYRLDDATEPEKAVLS